MTPQSNMDGFGSGPPSNIGASEYHERSSHYNSHNYPPSSNQSGAVSASSPPRPSYPQERHTPSRSRLVHGEGGESVRSSRRGRSSIPSRSSSNRGRSVQHHQHGQSSIGHNGHFSVPQNQSPPTHGGATHISSNDGNGMTQQHQYHSSQQHQQSHNIQFSNNEMNSSTMNQSSTPDLQNYPHPPNVSSSHSQSSSSQRRPAYLLHRELVIGKGSYGQVCIASRGESEGHTSSGRGKRKKFACKCVALRNDAKYIAKLQEEVNVLRELRGHENVIRLYDVFCVNNELFIITELGRGGDLFHLLTTHPKHGVTESYAAKTVAQMLSAVAFLHSRNICHRDLKLENWVLESGKDVWSPLKLIDFGLSTHFTPGNRLSRVVGSSYYVAPEVLKKSYTEACDLWSLGVIVYMLLSGAPPFYGRNDEAIKASIVQGEYTFPPELFRDVSDEAMAFVSTLLSYNIDYRYTADQALTHTWLSMNCDADTLQRARNGARGIGVHVDGTPSEPMHM
mmetsp:Transcript_8232/g.11762  ORF Transcript_8232/g.11762 Transcript_8232/m.11762 type:complete len:507 (+) Transcript_8232:608-2128(+)|eukprot:CAMPEP_0184856304 /NCGR_PEP_ID=MMETSP0580-20130426/1502_1 /TAXON_ID=1118495 /ORGANISM="Dactyliosolen fragilissimus" /LENGTH=506 /DNA_ID=CAMNT_0027351267 /DNA_START=486 /DNA_END=2006 /DNA_ORIENTATION=+